MRTSTRLLELEDEVWSSKSWILVMDWWSYEFRVLITLGELEEEERECEDEKMRLGSPK